MVGHGRDQAGLASPRWTIQQLQVHGKCVKCRWVMKVDWRPCVGVLIHEYPESFFLIFYGLSCGQDEWETADAIVAGVAGVFMTNEAPFELCAFIRVSHLIALGHADHYLVIFVHGADSQALLQVGVDACRKVSEAREKQVAHLIWHQLIHHTAHQHQRCRDGCSRGDGLLVGLDGLVVGRHEWCALQVSSWQEGSFYSTRNSVTISTVLVG